jgi:hypothetical protein
VRCVKEILSHRRKDAKEILDAQRPFPARVAERTIGFVNSVRWPLQGIGSNFFGATKFFPEL